MRRSCIPLFLFTLLAVFAPVAAAQHFSLDNTSLQGSRLFGQGAELVAKTYSVSSRRVEDTP